MIRRGNQRERDIWKRTGVSDLAVAFGDAFFLEVGCCSRLEPSHFQTRCGARAAPWMWAFVYSQPEGRFPAPHGYAATREEAMQAFASVWYG